jgi:hypothetical protein
MDGHLEGMAREEGEGGNGMKYAVDELTNKTAKGHDAIHHH